MSNLISKSLAVSKIRLRDRMWNKRLLMTGGVFFLFLFMTEEGIVRVAIQNRMYVSPYIFPFLSSDWVFQMMASGYFVWLVSDLCTVRPSDEYIRRRAGEKSWRFGNCIALLVSALAFSVGILVFSTSFFFPVLQPSMEWGRFWNTLSKVNSSAFGVRIQVSPMLPHLYKPSEAMFLSFLLQTLELSWLALLMYLLNSFSYTMMGLYVSVAFIFLDVFLSNTMQERYYRFSPVTLAQLGNYTLATRRYGMSLSYGILFFLLGNILFSILLLLEPGRMGESA